MVTAKLIYAFNSIGDSVGPCGVVAPSEQFSCEADGLSAEETAGTQYGVTY